MKYIVSFILLIIGWSSPGMEFPCEGKGYYEDLKRDLQNEMGLSQSQKAIKHLFLFYCQMNYGEVEVALQNLKESAELGDIFANYVLADYLLTGGWGKNPSVQSRDEAIWEFEKTLQKILNAGADYPTDPPMAEDEIDSKLYPNTLTQLMQGYTNKWLSDNEGFPYYKTDSIPYNNPAEILERGGRVDINILDPLERHIGNCLADDRGQAIPGWARRFSESITDLEQSITAYNAFYTKVKTKYCPLYKELLNEIRKREANMRKIAAHCATPSETPTKERPSCTDIEKEIEGFEKAFKSFLEKYKQAINS